MKRDSIVFYRSFYEAIKELPAEQQVECFHAIMDYALDGKEPEGNGIEKTVFALVRPQIDTNNKRYENGTKGGRQKNKEESKKEPEQNQEETKEEANLNQTGTKTEPKGNQNGTKLEPNVYVNDNVNVNDNVSVNTEKEIRARVRGEGEAGSVVGISGNDPATTPTRGMQFPVFWSVYPKQVEQQMAQQEYLSLLMSTPGLEEERLIQAARNYAESCQIQGTTTRFIKHPANWLSDGVWMDYMPDKYRRPETEEGKKARTPVKNRFNAFPQRSYSQAEYQSMEQRLLQRAGDG